MQAVRIVLSGRVAHLLGQDLRYRGDYPVSGPIANYEYIENPVFNEPAGAVSWYGGWSSICIFFDICEPFGTCNMFARICEADRERFAAACRKVWNNQGMCIKNEIVEIEAEA